MARNLPPVAAPAAGSFTAAIDLTPLQLDADSSLMFGFRGAAHADQWVVWFGQDSTLTPTPGSTAGLAGASVLPTVLQGPGPFVLPFSQQGPAPGTQCYVEHIAGSTVGAGVILISGSADPSASVPWPPGSPALVFAGFTTDGAGNIGVDSGATGVGGVAFSGTSVVVTFASPMPSTSYVVQGSFYSDVDDLDAHRGILTPVHGGRATGAVTLKLSGAVDPTAVPLRLMVQAVA
jgi:hypothetical protein